MHPSKHPNTLAATYAPQQPLKHPNNHLNNLATT